MKANNEKVKKKWAVPHTYVIILSVVVIIAMLTWVFPAGTYQRITDENSGKTIVDVGSFEYVENTPVGPFGVLKAIPTGMQKAASIVFFVFIMGGSFSVVQRTGAIDAGVSSAIRKMQGWDLLVIPLIMLLMSVLGFTIGAAEEVIAFVPITIMMARGFGYDDIVGVAMVSTGAAIGFAGGMLNPFTTGVGQSIAELPMYSAFWFRFAGYVMFYIIAVWYVMHYAHKVRKDPTKSVLYGLEKDEEIIEQATFEKFTLTHKLVLLAFVIGLGIMIYGVMKLDWYITEIAAVFLGVAIAAGVIARLTPNAVARAFVKGAREIVFGALVVGLARTILVVMEQGQILDSIIYSLAKSLETLPGSMVAVGMFLVNSLINFFIPSGSGQAATLVPVMAPLADVLGITRQTAVLAVTYGDAFSNQIIPTSGALMAVLGIAKIPYDKWLKYNWKLVVMWSVVGAIMIAIASIIDLGPF